MIAWLEVSSNLQRRAHLAHAVDRAVLRPLADRALRAAAVLGEWQRRRRDRGELARLDPRLLRDIGITRYDALQEASKPFWKE